MRTLRTLMTPVLPPFYRIFMGGLVPRHDPGDLRVGPRPRGPRPRLAARRTLAELGRRFLFCRRGPEVAG